MRLTSIILLFFISITAFAQEVVINKHIDGTILLPTDATINPPLALIIAGSGPTDRNGNQNFMT